LGAGKENLRSKENFQKGRNLHEEKKRGADQAGIEQKQKKE